MLLENGGSPKCSEEEDVKHLRSQLLLRESHRRGGVKVELPIEDRSLRILSSEIHGDDTPAPSEAITRAFDLRIN